MKYQLLPPLSAEEYAALEASIVEHGVLVPVEYDEDGNILDGHHRAAICKKLGIKQFPRVVREGLSEGDKRTHVRALNLARRHLTTFQKREIIRAQLLETPEASSRTLGTMLGVHHQTVLSQRRELEASGTLNPSSKIIGADGVRQAGKKPALPPTPMLSDGARLDLLPYHQVLRRIGDCERDLALLRAVVDYGSPVDDRMTVREFMPASFFEGVLT